MYKTCPTCYGFGVLVERLGVSYSYWAVEPKEREVECEDCDGRGVIKDEDYEDYEEGEDDDAE